MFPLDRGPTTTSLGLEIINIIIFSVLFDSYIFLVRFRTNTVIHIIQPMACRPIYISSWTHYRPVFCTLFYSFSSLKWINSWVCVSLEGTPGHALKSFDVTLRRSTIQIIDFHQQQAFIFFFFAGILFVCKDYMIWLHEAVYKRGDMIAYLSMHEHATLI